ncbi:MAG: hypothetical protein JSV49_05360, partial [Thermoplasmata archaeon]
RLQNFIHDHDFGKRSTGSSLVYSTIFIVATCGLIMGATQAWGTPYAVSIEVTITSSDPELPDLSGYAPSPVETTTDSGYLLEGETQTITISSEPEKYISLIVVTVTWQDEDDIQRVRTFQNQPDTFSVALSGLNSTPVEATGSNSHGSPGTINAELSFSKEQIAQGILDEGENYQCTIEITMVEAGPYIAPPLGAIGFVDDGNDFQYEAQITYLEPE